MANFIVTYDLNGANPSHAQIDNILRSISTRNARILESVWWVDFAGTAVGLRDRLNVHIGREDLLIVIEANSAAWTNLLVDPASLVQAWKEAA